jgi:hypothetical protein
VTASAARVLSTAEAFLASVAGFDPADALPADCVKLAAVAARVEKAAAGVRVLAAARAVGCGAHKEDGVADPVSWLARQGGTTGAQAREALELARSLDAHPETKEALLSGAVSVAQAQEIARFDKESPGQEHELVALAKEGDLSALRDEVRERRLAQKRPEELHEAQLAARSFRHWRDGLGMVCFEGALAPEAGIPFVSRIEREAARRHKEARRNGSSERFCAHAADALVALSQGNGGGAKAKTDLVVVCDLYAWRRGHAHESEPCQLIGGGPIPVDLAKQLADDAFLKVALHDGKDIQRILHVGRKCTAELRTALELGPVPAFSGAACVDCARTFGLEWDHEDPVAHTGPTSISNLRARCHPCHQEKTERDRKAGLLGNRAKALPPGTRPPRSAPRRTGSQGTGSHGVPRPKRASPSGPDPP